MLTVGGHNMWETAVQVKREKVYLFKDLTVVQPSRSDWYIALEQNHNGAIKIPPKIQ